MPAPPLLLVPAAPVVARGDLKKDAWDWARERDVAAGVAAEVDVEVTAFSTAFSTAAAGGANCLAAGGGLGGAEDEDLGSKSQMDDKDVAGLCDFAAAG